MPPLNLRAATLNQSDLADLQNFARSKKLKREHVEDIVKFMNLPSGPLLHEGYMYATQLATLEEVRRIATSQPPWAPSKDFVTNVRALCYGALLSTSARAYKGTTLTSNVSASPNKIVFERRFDLPSNICTIPADEAKVTKVITDQMSDARSGIKKDIAASVNHKPPKANAKPTKPNLDDADQHMGLKQLAENIGRHLGSRFELTAGFCARVALLRSVYMEFHEKNFWDKLEDKIEEYHFKARRKLEESGKALTADKIAAKVSKAFKGLVVQDRKTHGDTESNKNDGIDDLGEGGDELQQLIDQSFVPSGAGAGAGAGAGSNEQLDGPAGDEQ
ncbi:hypothetical protein FB45DRAFT_1019358 [Roridomyces roridus]|uniref:Uncharacterized protein n=1 Tax=Roridomyces roridus TaxID=1738132 RepID=A0AAD7FWF1_9AGAR|nr:hypothetical protein FB45DRAFT_1019358 [Roridomyces roridus]